MGLGVAQDEAQLRPRRPFCRPRTFKKEGQNMGPKKDTKNDDEGAKKGSKLGPEIGPKNDLKKEPNIISLGVGSLRLSGVGARPCSRKSR